MRLPIEKAPQTGLNQNRSPDRARIFRGKIIDK